VENIINDGTTTHQYRLGAVADFELVLRIKHIHDDVLVVSRPGFHQKKISGGLKKKLKKRRV
jgi:hypothetical protein